MTPELPAEIWVVIVKNAITTWPTASFNLLDDDFSCVGGFSSASKFFKSIVDRLRHENIALEDYDDFVFLCVPCHLVRYLRIVEALPSRQMYTNTFYNTLSDYNRLISLSICSPELAFTCSRLSDLSFASTLRRLDLRSKLRHDKTFWDAVTISLPNLLELRLGAVEVLEPDTGVSSNQDRTVRDRVYADVETFAINLASRLSRSTNLQILSLHILLNDSQFGVFDDKTTIWNEHVATLALAQTLTKLEKVSWRNPWIDDEEIYGEVVQRSTSIVRKEGGIDLLRDDQGYSNVHPSEVEQ